MIDTLEVLNANARQPTFETDVRSLQVGDWEYVLAVPAGEHFECATCGYKRTVEEVVEAFVEPLCPLGHGRSWVLVRVLRKVGEGNGG